jgi:hypothetical protein
MLDGGTMPLYIKRVKDRQPMHPYYTTNFADREMFAYNAAYNKSKAEIARINAHPEQRMKYCFEFMQGADEQMKKKCFDKIAEYSAQLDWSEAHY